MYIVVALSIYPNTLLGNLLEIYYNELFAVQRITIVVQRVVSSITNICSVMNHLQYNELTILCNELIVVQRTICRTMNLKTNDSMAPTRLTDRKFRRPAKQNLLVQFNVSVLSNHVTWHTSIGLYISCINGNCTVALSTSFTCSVYLLSSTGHQTDTLWPIPVPRMSSPVVCVVRLKSWVMALEWSIMTLRVSLTTFES